MLPGCWWLGRSQWVATVSGEPVFATFDPETAAPTNEPTSIRRSEQCANTLRNTSNGRQRSDDGSTSGPRLATTFRAPATKCSPTSRTFRSDGNRRYVAGVKDSAVLTVARLVAGATNNVIPETALIEGTIRAVSERTRA